MNEPYRYRVYRIGGTSTERFETRPILGLIFDAEAQPTDAQLDELHATYGQGSLLAVVEPEGSEMPETVADLLGLALAPDRGH